MTKNTIGKKLGSSALFIFGSLLYIIAGSIFTPGPKWHIADAEGLLMCAVAGLVFASWKRMGE